jgi:hypothetical protein
MAILAIVIILQLVVALLLKLDCMRLPSAASLLICSCTWLACHCMCLLPACMGWMSHIRQGMIGSQCQICLYTACNICQQTYPFFGPASWIDVLSHHIITPWIVCNSLCLSCYQTHVFSCTSFVWDAYIVKYIVVLKSCCVHAHPLTLVVTGALFELYWCLLCRRQTVLLQDTCCCDCKCTVLLCVQHSHWLVNCYCIVSLSICITLQASKEELLGFCFT